LTAGKVPVLVIAGEGASKERAARLDAAHVEAAFVRRDAAGHIDLLAALNFLAARGLTRIFCEGGPRLASALIGQGFADEVTILTAVEPLGRKGMPGLDGAASAVLANQRCYHLAESRMIGADSLTRYESML
jgi:diaminohydroxyphosphoribosylaminopyrimidine deaminase / 5-amino-6-(5-phosphoribosylamino)uracil reductase